MNTSGTESMDQEADGPGLFGGYVRVFISPDTLFQELRRRARNGTHSVLQARAPRGGVSRVYCEKIN